MVQVLENVPTFGEEFGRAIGQGASLGMRKALENRKKMAEIVKENEDVYNATGIRLTSKEPEMRKLEFSEALKGKYAKEKNQVDQFEDKQSYEKIKTTFGQQFADIWKAASSGGRTELLKHGMDAKLRGDNLEELLQGVEGPEADVSGKELHDIPQMKKGKIGKETKWPEFTKRPAGYTPKDWVEERKTWRKENSPVFLENKTKLQNSKRDEIAIKKLDKLNKSKKLPEGFGRSLINPSTGEIYGIAQLSEIASPETQEWIKEISRFQNRAKDAFGSRVTNFDLTSYMKQFPTLLNSAEGRERIIRMMGINNQLDQIYESALEKVYQKYGLNGIPQEEADKLAQSLIQEESDRLSDEYLSLDEQNQSEDSEELSGNMVDVIGPDGQEYEVDEREVEKLPEGFRLK